MRRWLGSEARSAVAEMALTASTAALAGLGAPSAAGVGVSEEGALRNTAVLACVRLLANSTAMLPLPVFRRIRRGKVREYSHPLYPILQEQANPEMTALELRRWLMVGVLLWGNGYAEIEWDELGQVRALWPLRPDAVTPVRRNGAVVYVVRLADGTAVELAAYRVLHLRGLTGDGLVGYSVVREMMRESVALGLATQEFGARFFGNGARPGIVVKHPGILSAKALANLQASWAGAHEGLSNAHRVRILEEGMDVATLGVPPDEAQFLETRRFQVTEIARAFGVPPHMVGDLDRATFSNIEHQGIEFGQFSLYPYLRQTEQTINAKCLTAEERRFLFVEHVTDALVRTDIKTRYEAHATAIQNGWMTRNEVRAMENLNAVEGGDAFLVPLNMVEAGEEPVASERQVTGDQSPVASERQVASDQWPVNSELPEWVRPLAEDVARRAARRVTADWKRAGARVADAEWRAEFFGEFEAAAATMAAPLLRAAGKAEATPEVGRALCEAAAGGWSDEAGLAGRMYVTIMDALKCQ